MTIRGALALACIACAGPGAAGPASWKEALGGRPFLYSPDYVDPYTYFRDDGEAELLTESIRVAFPQDAAERGAWKSTMISYRSVVREKGKGLEPDAAGAQGLMARLGYPSPEPPLPEAMLDAAGRRWSTYAWWGPPRRRLFCSILPEAYVCLTQGKDSPLSAEDFYQKVVSQAYVQNPFWKIAALEAYAGGSPTHPVLADARIVRRGAKGFAVRLVSLGRTFDVAGDYARDMVRVMGALVPGKKGEKPRWIAFGFHHFTPDRAVGDCAVEFSGEGPELREHFAELARRGHRPEGFRTAAVRGKLKLWRYCGN